MCQDSISHSIPDATGGAYSACPDPLAGGEGASRPSPRIPPLREGREAGMGGKGGGKGRGGEGEGKGREERGGRGGKGRGRWEVWPPTFLYPPPPLYTITNRENFHCKVSNRLSTTSARFY